MIRVAIVEDDDDIRKMTASLLNYNADIECIGSFSSAEHYQAALPTLAVDVVLMDIGVPDQNGIDCIRTCHPAFPNVEYIMFTDHIEAKVVFEIFTRDGCTSPITTRP